MLYETGLLLQVGLLNTHCVLLLAKLSKTDKQISPYKATTVDHYVIR